MTPFTLSPLVKLLPRAAKPSDSQYDRTPCVAVRGAFNLGKLKCRWMSPVSVHSA